MSKIEMILEAEKRGILPDKLRPLLEEARKRGLVPSERPSEMEVSNQIAETHKPFDMRTNAERAGEDIAGTALIAGLNAKKRTQIVPETVSAVGEAVANSKYDIAGGAAGGIAGARIGAPGGPIGIATGGFIGSILGATLGKEADEMAGTKDEASFGHNLLVSGGEEIVGRAFAGILSPIARRLAPPFSGSGVADDMISMKTIDPSSTLQRDITDAQDNIFGRRLMTIYEETQGRQGIEYQSLLNIDSAAAQRRTGTSAFKKTRDTIKQSIYDALSPSKTLEKTDSEIQSAMVKAMKAMKKDFDVKLDSLKPAMHDLATKTNVSLDGLEDKVLALRPALRYELGSDADAVFRIINKHFGNPMAEETGELFRKSVTAEQLQAFGKDLKKASGKFNQNANVQSEISAVLNKFVAPVFDDYMNSAVRSAKQGTPAAKYGKVLSEYNRIAGIRSGMMNSTIAKKLGLTESAQAAKNMDVEKLSRIVFDTPQTWAETKDVLNLVDPGLIPVLTDKFKTDVLREIVNPKFAGEPTFNNVNKVLKKYGDDLIKDVAGQHYWLTLNDARLITLGLDKTKFMTQGGSALADEQKIFQNIRRMMVHPMAGRVGLVQGLITPLRRFIGLGEVTDEHIMKMMQGEAGQRLIEKSMGDFVSDPTSYNTYVQIVRELGKVGAKVEPLTEQQYILGVSRGLNEAIDGLEAQE